MKKLLVTVLAVGILMLMSVSAFAAKATEDYSTPAEIVAGLTGRTVESVMSERTETGKTYGKIASDAGMLDEFKAACLKIKSDILADRVANGTITQADADAILAAIEENQAECDGTGTARMGRNGGVGFGSQGAGCNGSRGQGGRGVGGMRLQDGSCYAEN
ncbi:MAG: hypothetical protein RR461_02470 [Angelakisella sp.]